MDYTPLIETRTTEQLIEIITARHAWKDDVIRRAEIELQKRGVPLSVGENRRKSRNKYERKVRTIKAEASYSGREKFLVILLGPVLLLFLHDFIPFYGWKRV